MNRPLSSRTTLFSASGTLAAIAAVFIGTGSWASENLFPNKPVHIVVPYTPGGTADVLPRVLAEHLTQTWNVPVIIENVPGAGGNIGATQVARSPADGYTLLSSPPGPLAINQSIYKQLQYEASEFVPVSIFATVPIVLAVRSNLPVNNVQELIALAKKKKGELNFASAGNGSTPHLVAAMFMKEAGVDMAHVPYKGSSRALSDLVAGHVDIFFDNLTNAQQHYESGRIKIIAVASVDRLPRFPNIPTISESGVPNFTANTWYAAAVPKGTPTTIVKKLNAGLNEALKSSKVNELLKEWGAVAEGGTPEHAADFIKVEITKWKKAAAEANVQLD